MTGLLEQNRAALLVIDVQDRINAVMADQNHLPRIEVLVEACRGLDVPVLASEQYPQGLGPTVPSLATHATTTFAKRLRAVVEIKSSSPESKPTSVFSRQLSTSSP
jgi:nicotinamidase-related amidase